MTTHALEGEVLPKTVQTEPTVWKILPSSTARRWLAKAYWETYQQKQATVHGYMQALRKIPHLTNQIRPNLETVQQKLKEYRKSGQKIAQLCDNCALVEVPITYKYNDKEGRQEALIDIEEFTHRDSDSKAS